MDAKNNNHKTKTMIRRIQPYSLFFAWFIALIGMGTSLFFSEILGDEPCHLCWFQRIAMYPLVIILGIAVYRDDRSIRKYTLPLSMIGGLIAFYQYLEQKLTFFAQLTPCKVGVPCSGHYINWLGFITLPLLSFIAFVLITALLWITSEKPEDESEDETESEPETR